MSAPQGIEIGEKLLWKYEETHHFGFFLWFKKIFCLWLIESRTIMSVCLLVSLVIKISGKARVKLTYLLYTGNRRNFFLKMLIRIRNLHKKRIISLSLWVTEEITSPAEHNWQTAEIRVALPQKKYFIQIAWTFQSTEKLSLITRAQINILTNVH